MTTTLTQKDSQPRKEDAATQQIAREAACNWLFRDKSDAVSEDEIQDLTKAILSSIERATDTAWSDGFVAGSNTQLAIHAQPQPSKARKEQAPRAQGSPASGERSETPKCTCEDYDQRGAIRDPDCPLHNEYGEERPQRSEPRGQQQEWTDLYVLELLGNPKNQGWSLHPDRIKQVIAAHNAALDAAWQEHDDVVDALANFSETIKQLGARNHQLNEQLAAEREEQAIIERSRDAWKSQVVGLTAELAAERDRLATLSDLIRTAIRCGRGLGSEWQENAKKAIQ